MSERIDLTEVQLKRLARLIKEKCVEYDLQSYVSLLKNVDSKLNKEWVRKINFILKAISNFNRLKILLLLFEREMCGCEINILLGLSQPTTSHHLSVLQKAGLVSCRVSWRWKYYSLSEVGGKFLRFLLALN
ncbi:MAG: metalloregulator ArsR/SmtB family transcription factor [Candidatus Odinarchaeum yellowstonii]|uniref:Metalloregulator ArsR/SmtB family transcription factor n=1 Tax=Odinarchaeota yellowstonii (strain LCB_4) TaxID=1841599 RepID=A0AAF0IBX4_ODILC|nr:MAG: metalloregulator ArsR/SmtB family transcription factor [Candidatus Odinarchaeum yellowstonii]